MIYADQFLRSSSNYELTIKEGFNKTFYLRNITTTPIYIMNTTQGDVTTDTVTIYNGSFVYFYQLPDFAKSFEITSNVTVRLYFSPTPDGSIYPDIYVKLYYNDNLLFGEYILEDVSSAGWYNTSIPLGGQIKTVLFDKNLTLQIGVTSESGAPYTTLYYNSTSRNSSIEMQTVSYVNVDSLTTDKPTYALSETVLIRANVSDSIGSYDIKEARVTIKNSTNVVLVDNALMTLENSNSAWKLFNYSYTPPATGTYYVNVTATETNNVKNNSSVIRFDVV